MGIISTSVFVELKFWLLLLFSLIVPFGIYAVLLLKRAISRTSILFFGALMLLLSGIDIYLLGQLANIAKSTLTLTDDIFFVSEVSVALYLLPALFAGIGINMISHVLTRHLDDAEKRFHTDKTNQ
ncbi:hypothetical protein DTO96_101135 [Ephemeroptericola cinctiostellae]|uniref:Uncharacterized protein n=1 Tax=Ephemeroptericola cinctiostellae TaxID=2268024 RepID=A0A345DAL6_9BURK|nr:hypothetical protein [Ephemeroptericola cinctiostellae]AXF85404.1 hypothetical protein DTO96_101135 [Ephemeroptericola cinctiostellae]